MKLQTNTAKFFALAMILALPLFLAGCGPKPVATDNNNGTIDSTAGQNTGLTPSDESTGTVPSGDEPQNVRTINNDADIENILNNLNSDDKSKDVKTVDENDINQF